MLYTVRFRMALSGAYWRGTPFSDNVHHFHWEDDDAAVSGFSALTHHWQDSAIANRFLGTRGGPFHELSLWRRDIEFRRHWHKLAVHTFSLPNYQTHTVTIPLPEPGTSFELELSQRPNLPDQRGAMLIVTENAARTKAGRVYLGPMSSHALWGNWSVPIFDDLIVVQYPDVFGTLDPPFFPRDDDVDHWTDKLMHVGIAHVQDMNPIADPGYLVIPSWKHGTIDEVKYVSASPIRSVMKRRGMRADMFGRVEVVPHD